MVYRAIIEKGEDSGFIAHCPAIPGCHTQGQTIEEVVENIKDAIKGCLAVLDPEEVISERYASIEVDV